MGLLGIGEPKTSGQFDLGLEFVKRASRLSQKYGKTLVRQTAPAFGNIAGN